MTLSSNDDWSPTSNAYHNALNGGRRKGSSRKLILNVVEREIRHTILSQTCIISVDTSGSTGTATSVCNTKTTKTIRSLLRLMKCALRHVIKQPRRRADLFLTGENDQWKKRKAYNSLVYTPNISANRTEDLERKKTKTGCKERNHCFRKNRIPHLEAGPWCRYQHPQHNVRND